jgi:hypothetical protein
MVSLSVPPVPLWRTRRRVLVAGMVAGLAMFEGHASADDRATCFAAASQGQSLRDAHKLVEAREQFRRCAAAVCPSAVQSDCTGWLSDADKAIPTIVLAAKDASGNDLFDVSVSVDGKPLTSKIDGAAVPINPGPHTFRFQRGDGASVERQLLVLEGQKDLIVSVKLAPSGTSSAVPPPPSEPAAGSPPPASQGPSAPPAPSNALRTFGWVATGVGAVGLGVGAIFTGLTLADKSSGGCDAAGVCTNFGSINSAKSAAPIAGTGLIVGGALLVTGVVILLSTPSTAPNRPTTGLHAAPMVGTQGGGLSLEGAW